MIERRLNMNGSLSLVSPRPVERAQLQAQITQRLVLYRGELYRVPVCYQLLRIKAGIAYITQAGQDRILSIGQELQLDSTADMALVSGIGCEQVVLELFNS
jgi:hypothetical protein